MNAADFVTPGTCGWRSPSGTPCVRDVHLDHPDAHVRTGNTVPDRHDLTEGNHQ